MKNDSQLVESIGVGRVAEQFHIGIWNWDLVTNQLTFNDYCAKMLKMNPSDLINVPESEQVFLDAETYSTLSKRYYDWFQEGAREMISQEIEIIDANGKRKWILESATLSKSDENEKPLRISGIWQDIDENVKKRKEAESYIQMMLDSTPILCSIWDENVRLMDCNKEMVSLFEVASKEELIEKISELEPKRQANGVLSSELRINYIEEVLREGKKTFPWNYFSSKGEIIPTETTLVRTPWKKGFRLLAYSRDLRAILMEQERTLDTKNYMHLMLDSNPQICAIWSESLELIDCNMEVVRMFDLKNKEEYLHNFGKFNPTFQYDGQSSREKAACYIRKAFETGYQNINWDYMDPKTEERIPANITLIRVPYEQGYRVLAYSQDMREVNTALRNVDRYTSLLSTINKVSENLIMCDSENYVKVVHEQLRIIGEELGANVCRIWEHFTLNGESYFRQTFSWVSQANYSGKRWIEPFKKDDVPYVFNKLMEGEIVNVSVSNLPKKDRAVFIASDIKALLMEPVLTNNGIWGVITYENLINEETLPVIYEESLYSCCRLMASAITKNQTDENLMAARNDLSKRGRLLEAVNDVAKRLMDNNEQSISITTYECLKTLGQSVNGSRVSIWKNFENEEGILCGRRIGAWQEGVDQEKVAVDYVMEIPTYLPEWDKGVENRKDINLPLKDANEALRHMTALKDCKSLLVMHVEIDGKFWGYVSISHIQESHLYSETEIGILRAGSMMIAEGVVRYETNKQLVVAMKEAVASVRAKNEFLTRMSHEIRTPLNAVVGMTALAKRSKEEDKIKECLETIEKSSNHLANIINDVLDMSNIDLGKFKINLSEFNFGEMLEVTLGSLKVLSKEKRQQLFINYEEPFSRMMVTDKARLSQVIGNLVNNAIKFTPEEGQVIITIKESKIDKDTSDIIISIEDDGVGISPNFMPIVFEPFEQADGSLTRKYGGSGLGLALCKTILTKMGGTITAESIEGVGSTFTVKLPVMWSEECTRATEPKDITDDTIQIEKINWTNKRILLVEDVEINRVIVKKLLAGTKVSIKEATNGEEALRMFSDNPTHYDMILMDLQMPIMDGYEATRQIRSKADENAKSIPIYALTAHTYASDIDACIRAGMNGHIGKPIDSKVLISTINEVFG